MPPPAVRRQWIDLLRGLAVTGMVWAHAANTFLAVPLQQTAGYHTLSFYHGLIAPVFFWVAGLMRGIAASRPGPQRSSRPTVKRLFMIWGVGYLLHVPWMSLLRGDFSVSMQRILFQSDVLHCLAFSCLLLVLIEHLLPSLKHRRLAVLVVGAFTVLITPTMAGITTGLPLLDAYLDKQHGSLFPLFPWFGFAAAGFFCGSPWSPSWRHAALAGGMAFMLPCLRWHESTWSFFAERLGWVMLLALLVSNVPCRPRMWAWLLLAGRQSLLVYVAHLLMIHAVPWWHGAALDHAIGATQSPAMVLLIFASLLVASLLLAAANEHRKRKARALN